jgi:hypothetical protein
MKTKSPRSSCVKRSLPSGFRTKRLILRPISLDAYAPTAADTSHRFASKRRRGLAGNSGRKAANASDISATEVTKATATYLVSLQRIVAQKVEHLRASALPTFAVTSSGRQFICSHCGSGLSLSVVSPANGERFWSLEQLLSVARCVRGDPYENGEGRRPKYFSKIRDSARVRKQLREQPDPAPIVFRLNIVSVIRQMAGIVRAPLKQR